MNALKAIDNVLTYRLGEGDAWRDSLVEARAGFAELIDVLAEALLLQIPTGGLVCRVGRRWLLLRGNRHAPR